MGQLGSGVPRPRVRIRGLGRRVWGPKGAAQFLAHFLPGGAEEVNRPTAAAPLRYSSRAQPALPQPPVLLDIGRRITPSPYSQRRRSRPPAPLHLEPAPLHAKDILQTPRRSCVQEGPEDEGCSPISDQGFHSQYFGASGWQKCTLPPVPHFRARRNVRGYAPLPTDDRDENDLADDRDLRFSYTPKSSRKIPWKSIALALFLLLLGSHMEGDNSQAYGLLFLGVLAFLPGFYETRVAYYSWRGAPGYTFASIPDY
uniref:Uncharacterized protein n=1 Tax=Leersia perrieri TaxID=77586 RepID=A0A0D9VVI2_9ORYZ